MIFFIACLINTKFSVEAFLLTLISYIGMIILLIFFLIIFVKHAPELPRISILFCFFFLNTSLHYISFTLIIFHSFLFHCFFVSGYFPVYLSTYFLLTSFSSRFLLVIILLPFPHSFITFFNSFMQRWLWNR